MLLIAISTVLSVALAVAVNVATGGSLPGPLGQLQWLAWPLVAFLAAAVVVVGVWQGPRSEPAHRASALGPLVRPAELPPDVARFAGRDADLSALLAAVPRRPGTGLGAPVILGIFGAGGMGKTALATRLAHGVAARYPDGKLFVELRGATAQPANPAEVLRRMLHALGVAADAVPEDPAARQALYRSVLADRRVLLYLDDAGTEDQVRPLLPAGRGCLVLVTARPSLVGLSLTAWRNLDALTEPAAVALLTASVGDGRVHAEPEAASEVARHCGGLPLALSIAGARLRARPQWTVAELARRLADERRRLDELRIGDHDVRASFGLSYADLDPIAARLFRLLSLLGYADFGRGVASSLLGGIEHLHAAEAALERLADVKLVEIVGPLRYRFHDLVRLFAGERLLAEEQPAEQKAALRRALLYYMRRTREVWARLSGPESTEEDRAEADQWLEHRRTAIVAAVLGAVDAGEPEMAWQLAASLSPYLETRGYPVDMASAAEAAAQAARASGNQPALAAALRDLGQALRMRARTSAALAALTDSLALHEALGQEAAAAEVLDRIGDTEREAGQLVEAEQAYRRSAGIYRRLGDVRREAGVQVALAMAWLEDGRSADAAELVEEMVGRLGAGDPHARLDSTSAWALEILGAARQAQGRAAEAETWHRRSCDAFQAIGERFGAACALLNLGRCAAALGRPDEARRQYAESLRMFTEIGSPAKLAEVQAAMAALAPARGRAVAPK